MGTRKREDRLKLAGIRLQARIGTSIEERRIPQLCMADIILWGDFEAAAATDSLDKALDYEAIVKLSEAMAGRDEYNLVETLAYRIGRGILQEFPAHRVVVRLRKQPCALAGKLDYVQIEVEEA